MLSVSANNQAFSMLYLCRFIFYSSFLISLKILLASSVPLTLNHFSASAAELKNVYFPSTI